MSTNQLISDLPGAGPDATAPGELHASGTRGAEGADDALRIASLGRRAVAHLVDGAMILLLAVPVLIAAAIVSILSGGPVRASLSVEIDRVSTAGELLTYAGIQLALALVPLVYVILLTARTGAWNGRTVGKRALGLRVVSADGTALTPRAARRRAAVLVLPFYLAVAAGAALDAVAGTPPVLTFVGYGIGFAVLFADFVIAPLRGDGRATIHDRLAGTRVVVDHSTAPAPGLAQPIVARPKTGATTTWGVLGTLAALLMLVVVIAGATGSVGAGSDDEGTVAFENGEFTVEGDPDELAEFNDRLEATRLSMEAVDGALEDIRTADFAEAAVTKALPAIAVYWAECLGTTAGDPTGCVSDGDMVFDDGTVTLTGQNSAVNGGPEVARQIGVFVSDDEEDSDLVIYDRDGFGWGFTYSGDSFRAICMHAETRCDLKVHAAGKRFMANSGHDSQMLAEKARVAARQQAESEAG